MTRLATCLDQAITEAITGLRTGAGYSWADIALRLGISRQAAQQRWGATPGHDHDHDGPGTSGSRP